MFNNREEYRIFLKSCKLYLNNEDKGICPFEQTMSIMNIKRDFMPGTDCHIFCGFIFPEIEDSLDSAYCPCTIALGDECEADFPGREDLIKNFIYTRVKNKYDKVLSKYNSLYNKKKIKPARLTFYVA